MTGALVAHAFASAGISTILIEASAFGRGSTAASSALLLQEPDLELTELTHRYGKRMAHRIWQMSRESVHALVRLLARLRIACDLKQRDAVYYAIDGQAVARLREEYEIRRRSGFEARWGLFAMTPDSLPYIGPHRRYPRQWFALGYGGNGMTFGFLAARLLLERWQGHVTRDHAFFDFGRTRRR
jgi:glycine/D-amino acid oxidase-like deaminating enzyme